MFGTKKTVEAKRVGPHLVATFHNSQPRLIWKFDLEKNHSFTLALQGEEGDWELGITSPKGEFYPVVHFAAREDADEAFTAVQKILMKRKYGALKCVFKIVTGLAVIAIAIILVMAFISGHSRMTAIGPAAGPDEIPSGVPLPADEFLKPPPRSP